MERGRFVTEEDSKGSPLGLEKRVESTNKSRKTLQDKQLTTARVREMRGHVVAADHMFWQRGSWFRVVLGDWAPLNGTLNLNSQGEALLQAILFFIIGYLVMLINILN
jgi:hypothetical protein